MVERKGSELAPMTEDRGRDEEPDTVPRERSEGAHALAGMAWFLIIIGAVIVGIVALSFFEPSLGTLSGLAFVGFVAYVTIRTGQWRWYFNKQNRVSTWFIIGFFLFLILISNG